MTSKLFSISCKSSNDLLARLLLNISESAYRLCSVSQCSTGVEDIMLITLELEIEGRSVDTFIETIYAIDGVQHVVVSFGTVMQMASYHLRFNSNSLDTLSILKYHNAQVIHIEAGILLIIHIASEKDIRLLYDKLVGTSIIEFSVIPVALGQSLPWYDTV